METVDLMAAIVDDPFSFGMVAAANGLSDVYTMGAKPVTAMNIVCFPTESMDISVLSRILEGALAKLTEAGVALVGGHSVKNDDLKFGLCVTGIVHPDRVVTKSGARPGDRLILTKPLGTGILTTAIKAGMLPEKVRDRLTAQMTQLNDKASSVMLAVGIHAATDVTGFGLLGHLAEMAESSGVSFELKAEAVPIIPEVREFAHKGLIPEGMYANWEFRAPMVDVTSVDEDTVSILFDPQTSGGLLIAVAAEEAEAMLSRLHAAGVGEAAIIGRALAGDKCRIRVL